LTYQWYLNGSALGHRAQSSTYTLNYAQPYNAGNYTVVVSGPGGSVTSAVAVLMVYVPSSINLQPQNQAVVQGQTASFSVGASGTAPLSYQWNLNGTNVSGATNATLALTHVQATQAGSYTLVVTNFAGSVTSAVASLTVYVPATITSQPQSLMVTQGQAASFSVGALGTANLSYQWYFNGSALGGGGAQNSALALGAVGTTNAGSYTVVVQNNYGSATSAVAMLTVEVLPGIAT
jgi:hypothetical protein